MYLKLNFNVSFLKQFKKKIFISNKMLEEQISVDFDPNTSINYKTESKIKRVCKPLLCSCIVTIMWVGSCVLSFYAGEYYDKGHNITHT